MPCGQQASLKCLLSGPVGGAPRESSRAGPPGLAIESKIVLLIAKQANKSRDKLLGQGIVTLFGKPADGEDSGLLSQRTVFPELQLRLLLY